MKLRVKAKVLVSQHVLETKLLFLQLGELFSRRRLGSLSLQDTIAREATNTLVVDIPASPGMDNEYPRSISPYFSKIRSVYVAEHLTVLPEVSINWEGRPGGKGIIFIPGVCLLYIYHHPVLHSTIDGVAELH